MTADIEVGATLRHHDGRTGTFVCVEGDGRYRTQSLKGKGYWIFHPDDCERIPSPTTNSAAHCAEAHALNPHDPDRPSESMISAGLAVDWNNEDERATVVNVWYAMVSKQREDAQPVGWATLSDLQRLMADGEARLNSRASMFALHRDGCAALFIHPAPATLRIAVADIAAERQRQIDSEGCSPEYDDKYATGEMALAAACYALSAGNHEAAPVALEEAMFDCWPWSRSWWKPTSSRRDLVKAGALIVAEIERIDRQALAAPQANQKGDA